MPLALVACVALVLAATSGALAGPVSAVDGPRASGTSSKKPSSAIGQSPVGRAAQPGYDLATGLGSLNAQAFAAAVDSLP